MNADEARTAGRNAPPEPQRPHPLPVKAGRGVVTTFAVSTASSDSGLSSARLR